MKIRIFLPFISLFLFLIACDSTEITPEQADSFIKYYGSWSADQGMDIKTFNSGYLLLATTTKTTGEVAENTDITVMYLNKYGNLEGEMIHIDGGGNDEASKLILTDDGGFMVLGTLYDTSAANQDILMAKYGADLSQEWQKTIGTSANEQGVDILKYNGGYLLAGNTDKADAVTGNPQGIWDIYMLKTDESGDVEWENTFGAEGDDRSSSVIQHSEGFLVLGVSNSFNEEGQGGDDIIAIKTNYTGGETDKFTYGSIYDDYGGAVLEASEGFLIAGWVENISGENADVYLALVEKDDLHQIIWNKSFGKNLNDRAYDVLEKDGTFIVVGAQGSITGDYGYLLRVDGDGNAIAEHVYGGYNQRLHAIEVLSDGSYILTGSSGQEGNEQVCLIKLNQEGEL